MRLRTIAFALALLLVGVASYGVGRRQAPAAPAVAPLPATPLSVVRATTSGSLSAVDREWLRDEIVAAVRAERGSSAPAATAAPAEQRDPNPSADQSAERSEAQAVLDKAIAHGHWCDADRASLQVLLHRLDPDARATLISAFARAANEGRIAIDTRGAPL